MIRLKLIIKFECLLPSKTSRYLFVKRGFQQWKQHRWFVCFWFRPRWPFQSRSSVVSRELLVVSMPFPENSHSLSACNGWFWPFHHMSAEVRFWTLSGSCQLLIASPKHQILAVLKSSLVFTRRITWARALDTELIVHVQSFIQITYVIDKPIYIDSMSLSRDNLSIRDYFIFSIILRVASRWTGWTRRFGFGE